MNGSNQHGIAFQKTPSRISCAITTAIDGSEDDAIHCFKTGQPCANGRQELMKEMERNRVDDSDDDPFAAEEKLKKMKLVLKVMMRTQLILSVQT